MPRLFVLCLLAQTSLYVCLSDFMMQILFVHLTVVFQLPSETDICERSELLIMEEVGIVSASVIRWDMGS